ncbi:MAG: hypothetical protein WA847_08790, partial [Terriglobales bacterium]
MRRAPVITLSPEQRTVLESQARSRSFPLRVVERARIVLLAASGQQDKEIAARMVTTPKKVSRLAQAFPRAGGGGVAARRAPTGTQTHDQCAPEATRRDHDHAPAAQQRH